MAHNIHDQLLVEMEDNWEELGPLEESWFELMTATVEQRHNNGTASSEHGSLTNIANDASDSIDLDEISASQPSSGQNINEPSSTSLNNDSFSVDVTKSLNSRSLPVDSLFSSPILSSTPEITRSVRRKIYDTGQKTQPETNTPSFKLETKEPSKFVQLSRKTLVEKCVGYKFMTPPLERISSLTALSFIKAGHTPESIVERFKNNNMIPSGIDFNDSFTSWTSSLATPKQPMPDGTDALSCSSVESEKDSSSRPKQSIGAARMLFSPDAKNSTQEFDVMTGLNELNFSQQYEELETTALEEEYICNDGGLTSSQVELSQAVSSQTTKRSAFLSFEVELSTDTDCYRYCERQVPDPGGGGDTEKHLCSEDNYSQKGEYLSQPFSEPEPLVERIKVYNPTLEVSKELPLAMTAPETSKPLIEIKTETKTNTISQDFHLENRHESKLTSTPLPSESPIVKQESPGIHGFLSLLFGTPPSSSTVLRKPAPKRGRKSLYDQSKEGAISDTHKPRGSCPKTSPRITDNYHDNAHTSMLQFEKASSTPPSTLARDMPILKKASQTIATSDVTQKLDRKNFELSHENKNFTFSNMEDELDFSQLSPELMSVLLEAGEVTDGKQSSHNAEITSVFTPSNSGDKTSKSPVILKKLFTPSPQTSSKTIPSNLQSPANVVPVTTASTTSSLPVTSSSLPATSTKPISSCTSTTTRSTSSLSRRCQQRFMYPTKTDIKESCPTAVYNLKHSSIIDEPKVTVVDVPLKQEAEVQEDIKPQRVHHNPYVKRKLASSGFTTLSAFNATEEGKKYLNCDSTKIEEKPPKRFKEDITEKGSPRNQMLITQKTELQSRTTDLSHAVHNSISRGKHSDLNRVNHITASQMREITESTEALLQAVEDFSQVVEDDDPEIVFNFKATCQSEKQNRDVSGFATASGKVIHMNEEAIKKAEKLLEDGTFTEGKSLDELQNKVKGAATVNSFFSGELTTDISLGFATASGKTIIMKTEALMTAKKLLDDENLFVNESLQEDTMVTKALTAEPDVCDNIADELQLRACVFSSASGKTISMKEDALMRAKKLFEEDSSHIEKSAQEGMDTQAWQKLAAGFSTVSGNNIELKQEAVIRANKLLEDGNSCKDETLQVVGAIDFPVAITNANVGFSTASGKTISINEAALVTAMQILDHDNPSEEKSLDNLETINEKDIAGPPTSSLDELKLNFVDGFATASGKTIIMKQETLTRAKKLLEDDNLMKVKSYKEADNLAQNNLCTEMTPTESEIPDDSFCDIDLDELDCIDPSNKRIHAVTSSGTDNETTNMLQSQSSGFTTGRGNLISLSNSALERAKKLLDDPEDSVDLVTTSLQPVMSSTQKPGAKNSLLAFEDDDNCTHSDATENISQDASKVESNKYPQFYTASGYSVSVSEDAIKNAKKLLLENENMSNAPDNFIVPDVDLSGEELSKNCFRQPKKTELNIENDTKLNTMEMHTNESGFKGFCTARGTAVSVSEQALKAARNLLEDSNMESPASTSTTFSGFSNARASVLMQPPVTADNIISESKSLKTTFPGFSTAKGTHVAVTKHAFEAAEKLLDERSEPKKTMVQAMETAKKIFEDSVLNQPLESVNYPKSGTTVCISKKALQSAKMILDKDINTEAQFVTASKQEQVQPIGFPGLKARAAADVPWKLLGDSITVLKPAVSLDFTGSSVVSVKCVSRCLQSQVTSKKLLDQSSVPESKPSTSLGITGFTTAKGTHISISEESLESANKLLCEYHVTTQEKPISSFCKTEETSSPSALVLPEAEITNKLMNERSMLMETPVSAEFGGFTTGRGLSVSVSKKALEAARKLLEEESTTKAMPVTLMGQTSSDALAGGKAVPVYKNESDPEIIWPLTKNLKYTEDFADSSTARATEVQVSKTSLEAAKSILDEDFSLTHKAPALSVFSTATGTSVSVSKSALEIETARNFLNDDSFRSNPEAKTSAPSGFTGFSTARGTIVPISKSALLVAQKLLDDESNSKTSNSLQYKSPASADAAGFSTAKGTSESDAKKLLNSDSSSLPDPACTGFTGFSTARGKCVPVSKTALEAAKKLLENANTSSAEHVNTTSTSFAEFSTARGISVAISKTALVAAKNLLDDEADAGHRKCAIEHHISASAGFSGFSTARGTSVPVSKTALAAAKKLLDDEADAGCLTSITECKTSASASLPGFSKHKGTSVPVSKTAMAAAKKLLDEADDGCGTSAEHNASSSASFAGFFTARGTSVSVSKTALAAAKKLLEDEADAGCRTSAITNNTSASAGFAGISTARETSVPVSKTALTADNKLIDDEADAGCRTSVSEYNTSASGFVGFYTARGTSVPVSKTALTAAKKLLHNEADVEEAQSAYLELNNLTEKGFAGFFTARGASVSVSESATNAAKKLLHEDNDQDLQQVVPELQSNNSPVQLPCPKAAAFTGFSSANVTSVSVSKKALDAARMLLDDTDQKYTSELEKREAVPEKVHAVDKTYAIITKEVDLSLEAEESVKALLEDDEWELSQQTQNDDTLIRNNVHEPAATPQSFAKIPTKAFIVPVKRSGFKTPVKALPNQSGFQTHVKSSADTFISPMKVDDVKCNKPGQKRSHETLESESLSKIAKFEYDAADKDNQNQCHDDSKPKNTTKVLAPSEVRKRRATARLTQAKNIKDKRESGKIKQSPGYLFQKKSQSPKIPLKDYVMGCLPQSYSKKEVCMHGVKSSIVDITITNAEDYRFDLKSHYPTSQVDFLDSIQLGDGAFVVLDEYSTIGKEEICNGFLEMEGVDPTLISRDWVFNHYKWIIWKLAAVEVCFPHMFGARALTPNQVMLQLKLRYDREIDNSQRSCIKKIYEQDDTPARPMVLCVCAIQQPKVQENKASQPMLQLTDGWYSIPAQIDPALSHLISSNRIHVGDKLYICGGELLGNPEPCPPLQASSEVILKLSCNSTRRARWGAKLGFSFTRQPMTLPLSSLYPNGGMVTCVDIMITRKYPLQYMEKCVNGTAVFRSERSEVKAAQAFEKDRQKHMEGLYAKLQRDFESRVAKIDGSSQRSRRNGERLTAEKVRLLQTGQEIHEAMQNAADPSDLEALLSSHQMILLCNYRRHLQDNLQADITAEFQKRLADENNEVTRRNVTSLLKVRLSGLSNADIDAKCNVLLTIWRPTEDLVQLFTEGKAMRIHNLQASDNRGKGTAAVLLTATRATQYCEISVDEHLSDIVYEAREVTSASEMKYNFQPRYSEVDIVGFVIHVTNTGTFARPSGSEGQVQTVYLADASHHLFAVKFWGGIASYGLEDIVREKALVACSNLQWRNESRSRVPTLVASELSYFTSSPRDNHLKSALSRLQSSIQNREEFLAEMKLNLDYVLNMQSGYQQTPGTATPNAAAIKHPQVTHFGRQYPSIFGSEYQATLKSSASGPKNPPTTPGPATVNQPTTPGPATVNQPKTPGPATVNQPTTPGPATVNKPTTPGPTTVNQPTTPGPATVNQPTTPGPATVNKPTTPGPATVNQPTTPGPATVNQPTTPGPTTVNQPTTPVPVAVNQLTTPWLATVNQLTTPGPITTQAVTAGDSYVDPVLAKRQQMQRQKAERLTQYGSPPRISPLTSPANPVVYKAFKPPTFKTPAGGFKTPAKMKPLSDGETSKVLSSNIPDPAVIPGQDCDLARPTSAPTSVTPASSVADVRQVCGVKTAESLHLSSNTASRGRGRRSLGSRRSLSWKKTDLQQLHTRRDPSPNTVSDSISYVNISDIHTDNIIHTEKTSSGTDIVNLDKFATDNINTDKSCEDIFKNTPIMSDLNGAYGNDDNITDSEKSCKHTNDHAIQHSQSSSVQESCISQTVSKSTQSSQACTAEETNHMKSNDISQVNNTTTSGKSKTQTKSRLSKGRKRKRY